MKEFYTIDDRIYVLDDGRNIEITESDTGIIDEIFDKISLYYPEALSCLEKIYANSAMNVRYYRFLIVSRFIKCNFGELDTKDADITSNGVFNFEKVRCPLRGECKHEGVICAPKFNTTLSKAETRVMALFKHNDCIDAIADELYLSGHTVRNHIKAAYIKLGIHSRAEFVTYCNIHHMFD